MLVIIAFRLFLIWLDLLLALALLDQVHGWLVAREMRRHHRELIAIREAARKA